MKPYVKLNQYNGVVAGSLVFINTPPIEGNWIRVINPYYLQNSVFTLAANGGTNGTATLSFADTSLINFGQYVFGTGIPIGTSVMSVSSGSITLTNNLTSDYSGSYTFLSFS
jgi:hypothetical protein